LGSGGESQDAPGQEGRRSNEGRLLAGSGKAPQLLVSMGGGGGGKNGSQKEQKATVRKENKGKAATKQINRNKKEHKGQRGVENVASSNQGERGRIELLRVTWGVGGMKFESLRDLKRKDSDPCLEGKIYW